MRIPEPPTELTLPMNWRRLRYNLHCIGWTIGQLARRARIDEGSARQMCRGERSIPDPLARWTESLAAMHRAMSEPFEWEPKGRDGKPSKAALAWRPPVLDTSTDPTPASHDYEDEPLA